MILNLSLGLRDRGVPAHIYVYDDTESSFTKLARDSEISVHVEKKPRGFSLALVRRLVRYCASHQIRVIHTHDLNALIYGTLARLWSFGRVRVIHTQHSFVHLDRPRQKLFEKIFPRLASQIVCPSQWNVDQYVELGYRREDLVCVGNGIDFPKDNAPTEKLEARRALMASWPKETSEALATSVAKTWWVCMARLHPGKGQDHWLSVLEKLGDEARKKTLTLIVGPPTDAEFAEYIGRNAERFVREGSVVLCGPTSEPFSYYRACDFFVSLSDFEGMPLAPIEAAGSGLHLVLSDIPGHRSLGLPESVVDYWPVDQLLADRSQLRECFQLASRPHNREAAADCAAVLCNRYGQESMVQGYLDVYSEVLK